MAHPLRRQCADSTVNRHKTVSGITYRIMIVDQFFYGCALFARTAYHRGASQIRSNRDGIRTLQSPYRNDTVQY